MKALQQVIATLQDKNTKLQEENRKLKEKLDTMEQKSTQALINSHNPKVERNHLFKTLDTWGPDFSIKFDLYLQ